MNNRFVRLGETQRKTIDFRVDGMPATALEGDTLLVALLQHGKRLRTSEFGDGERAGFCLMGACQDCWVRSSDGRRLRSCSTEVEQGMDIITTPLDVTWPNQSAR